MRRGYADTRLGQLHYAMAGDTAKTPVILLPQSGRTWRMFVGLAESLSDKYCLYAIDYPGSGASDPLPPGAGIEDIAAAVVDLLDALRMARVHVYGIHTGNKVAAALAAAWPARVNKLVLAGQSHSIVPSNAKRSGIIGAAHRNLSASADEREAALVQWADLFSVISTAWWQEGLVRNIADKSLRARAMLKVTDEVQSAEGISHLYAANFSYDLERDLHRISVPTLILEIATPSEDRLVGRQGPALLSIIPGSTLVTLEQPDFHGITLEDRTEELGEILGRFLGEHS